MNDTEAKDRIIELAKTNPRKTRKWFKQTIGDIHQSQITRCLTALEYEGRLYGHTLTNNNVVYDFEPPKKDTCKVSALDYDADTPNCRSTEVEVSPGRKIVKFGTLFKAGKGQTHGKILHGSCFSSIYIISPEG